MVTEIYADLLFLINFSMDYLCLYICARILHRKMNLYKMVIASALGGIHSVVSLLIDTSGLTSILIDILICTIMCAIVFAEKKNAILSIPLYSLLFIGISMMTGGAMTAIFNLLNKLDLPIDSIDDDGVSPYIFILLALLSGVITLGTGKIFSKKTAVTTCSIRVKVNGKEAIFKALSDSGNLVRDPIGNKPIVLLDRSVLSKIVDISYFDDFTNGNLPKNLPYKNTRIVPIKTAAGSSIIVAISPDDLIAEIYDTKKKATRVLSLDALVAPSNLGSIDDGCNAIIPADILKF